MINRVKIFWILVLFSAAAFGQGNVSVKTEVDKNEITIGDLINYSFTITASQDAEVKTPPLGINLGMFEIRDYEIHDPEKENGNWIFKSEYTITTYDTGNYEIPTLPILYKFPTDTADHILYTDAVKVRVRSVKPSEAEDILDIKAPLEFVKKYKTLIIIGAVVLLLLILGVSGYIYYRKKKGKDLFKIFKEPEIPPDEKALKALQELKESDLIETGQVKKYYIRLSEIVRTYFEGRYFFPSLEKTTDETIDGLVNNEVENEIIDISRQLLENSDLVKFAKHLPEQKDIESDFLLAESIVDKTKITYSIPEKKEEIEEPVAVENTESGLEKTENNRIEENE